MAAKKLSCVACGEIDSPKRRSQSICISCENDPNVVYDKKCISCGETTSSLNFRHNRKKCLDCERSHGRQYRKQTTKAIEWTENNKSKMKELQHRNYEANKKTIRARETYRLQTDDHFRMIKAYRGSICRLLNGKINSYKKLNITRYQYLAWMEFCFDKEMTLENHGDFWQIDHIIPLDVLKAKCVNEVSVRSRCIIEWYNTAPVKKDFNEKKNKRLNLDQLASHMKITKKFIKLYADELGIDMSNNYYRKYKKVAKKLLVSCV